MKQLTAWLLPVLFLGALPASGSYQLNSYGFGTGGTGGTASGNYRINGIAGDVAGTGTSTNYKAQLGETHSKEANVPTVALTNDDNWYNKLHLVIGPEANPSDALFAVAISTDNFVTTQYVKSDLTIDSTLTFADYQTYTGWGSAVGVMLRGLARTTVYTAKVKAYRGEFTESAYGPTASASTFDPQIAFDIDVAATDISTSPPYAIGFGNLPVSTVSTTTNRIWVSFETNGESGGKVYVSGQNAGLRSLASTYTIASQTGDLAALAEGFGAQGVTATQTSGGPFTLTAPYSGAGGNVGVADAVIREVFGAAGPLVAGRGSMSLKAKTKPMTPAAPDYAEILTMIASANF